MKFSFRNIPANFHVLHCWSVSNFWSMTVTFQHCCLIYKSKQFICRWSCETLWYDSRTHWYQSSSFSQWLYMLDISSAEVKGSFFFWIIWSHWKSGPVHSMRVDQYNIWEFNLPLTLSSLCPFPLCWSDLTTSALSEIQHKAEIWFN